MENKKGLSFPFLIIAIILGVILFKQFDFETLTFEQPAMAVVYFIGFAIAVYALIGGYKKRSDQ